MKNKRDFEAALDQRFGLGRWHCDDLVDDPTTPQVVKDFVQFHRSLAFARHTGEDIDRPAPTLFAVYRGRPVRVVSANRAGDVGISEDLSATNAATARVFLPELTGFSDKAPEGPDAEK